MTGLLWILAYYDVGGLRDPWFTIFVDLDQSFTGGITQVLASMCVIELSREVLISLFILSNYILMFFLSVHNNSNCRVKKQQRTN
jgi:hypothetical protein